MPSSNDIIQFEKTDVENTIDSFMKSDEAYDKTPVRSKKPVALLLGGQPASGKTTIQRMQERIDSNFIIVNGDEFRRDHPNFEEIQSTYGKDSVTYTQPFSNAVVEGLIEKLSAEKYNLIIEGTLRNPDTQINTSNMLKEKGYRVELHVMAVDKETSWQGTLNRYNEMKALGQTPRATPKAGHDETVAKLPDNISKAFESNSFDRITLVTRSAEYLYDSDKTPEINPKSKLHQALNASNRQEQSVPDKGKFSIKSLRERQAKINADYQKKKPTRKPHLNPDSRPKI